MTGFVGYILLFLAVAAGFIIVHLLAGKLLRPAKPGEEKLAIYECGEETIGSAWIQFDLRYYVIALLFVIFDVEVAFFFPWAIVFGKANALANPNLSAEQRVELTKELTPNRNGNEATDQVISANTAQLFGWIAFADIAVFFGVLLVGFAYLWKRGDLDWVRSVAAQQMPAPLEEPPAPALAQKKEELLVGAS